MQLVLHAGAHATDEDRLIRCLLKNRDSWSAEGIAVPGPSRYRRLLRDVLNELSRSPAAPDARDVILDAVLDQDAPRRLILSNENFFSNPKLALRRGRFYDRAEARLAAIRQLFPEEQIELYLAIRNPATFLPALFALAPFGELAEFLGDTDPLKLRWSELVARLRAAHPDIGITVWCNEDLPFIWAELLRDIGGRGHDDQISGGYDILREIMTKEGMQRFRTYVDDHPTITERQKRRVIAAFLDKYAMPEAIEEEITLPGWDAALVGRLTDLYERDVAALEQVEGITVIVP